MMNDRKIIYILKALFPCRTLERFSGQLHSLPPLPSQQANESLLLKEYTDEKFLEVF